MLPVKNTASGNNLGVETAPNRCCKCDVRQYIALIHAAEQVSLLQFVFLRAFMSINALTCRFLPESMTWRDLFDIVIVQARKPAFWGDGTGAPSLAASVPMHTSQVFESLMP